MKLFLDSPLSEKHLYSEPFGLLPNLCAFTKRYYLSLVFSAVQLTKLIARYCRFNGVYKIMRKLANKCKELFVNKVFFSAFFSISFDILFILVWLCINSALEALVDKLFLNSSISEELSIDHLKIVFAVCTITPIMIYVITDIKKVLSQALRKIEYRKQVESGKVLSENFERSKILH